MRGLRRSPSPTSRERRLCRQLSRARAATRRARDRLDTTQAAMNRLERTQREFIDLVAHEVRTPLTAILRGLDLLRTDLERIAPPGTEGEAQEHARVVAPLITRNGKRLDRLLDAILTLTSSYERARRLDLSSVPAADFVTALVAAATVGAGSAGARVVNELGEADWFLLADRDLLQPALAGLLRGAPAEGVSAPEFRLREVSAVPGCGVANELIDPVAAQRFVTQPAFAAWRATPLSWRLVEIVCAGPAALPAGLPTRRAALTPRSTLPPYRGESGLELAVAQQAVEMHGGRLIGEVTPDSGYALYLLLPAVPGPTPVSRSVGIPPAHGQAGAPVSGDETRHGVGSAARDEEVDEGADRAPLEVEL